MSTVRPFSGAPGATAYGPLVVVGISHRTATVALRERAALTEPLCGALAARGRLSPETVAAAGFHHTGPDALRHLFRVAAGLDSMVVGEPEIQHQVRRSAAVAAEEGMLGDDLAAVFHAALAAGRRVRRETGVGRGAVSAPGPVLRRADVARPAPRLASAA